MKGQGKELEEPTPVMKSQISKFNKRKGNFQQSSNGSSQGLDQLHMSEKDINVSSQVKFLIQFCFSNDTCHLGGAGEDVVHN